MYSMFISSIQHNELVFTCTVQWFPNAFQFYQDKCCCCLVASAVSDSVRPHRRQPTRLPHPWDSPGKNTGVGCHFLLQCMKVKSESEVAQSCLTLSDPMDCSLPGSSIHGIFQARGLEWGAIAFSRINRYWQMSPSHIPLFIYVIINVNMKTCSLREQWGSSANVSTIGTSLLGKGPLD